jgi:glycosyltransferase involved in cell wall biosynthesis
MSLWTVIVLTTPSRYKTCFPKIIDSLLEQAEGKPVEILGLFDNKKQNLGAKRNSAVAASTGKYISFIDDDDEVSKDYIDSILSEIVRNKDADAVFFDQLIKEVDTGRETYCTYSPTLSCDSISQIGEDGRELKKMLVPHTAVWARRFFEDFEFGQEMPEDMLWSRRTNPKLRKWSHIKKAMYVYNFEPSNSEWRKGGVKLSEANEELGDYLKNGNSFSI